MALSFTHQNTIVSVGDTVRIHQEISEGGKARVQVFEGIVIAVKNSGTGKSFTVRRVGASSVAVEKIYPTLLPSIKKIEIKSQGAVRRGKLYYLRDRVGKAATRIKEKKTVAPTTATA